MAGVWTRMGTYGDNIFKIVGTLRFPNNPIHMQTGGADKDTMEC